MKRTLAVLLLASGTTLLMAAPATAQPISEPASCQGYLAAWANPSYGFIVQELVRPAAADRGVTVGQVILESAQVHAGSLEDCIP